MREFEAWRLWENYSRLFSYLWLLLDVGATNFVRMPEGMHAYHVKLHTTFRKFVNVFCSGFFTPQGREVWWRMHLDSKRAVSLSFNFWLLASWVSLEQAVWTSKPGVEQLWTASLEDPLPLYRTVYFRASGFSHVYVATLFHPRSQRTEKLDKW